MSVEEKDNGDLLKTPQRETKEELTEQTKLARR